MLDSLDFKLVNALLKNGRSTWAELAAYLKLSSPSTAERVKRLEEKGVIKGYTAKIDYEALGYVVVAFVAVCLEHPKYIDQFVGAIEKLPEVEECHHVAGDDDYFLKVRCSSNQKLDEFLNKKLKTIPGVHRSRTTIALRSIKEEYMSEVKEAGK